MAVYDDQKSRENEDIGDEELRRLTGISPDEEGAMDREAHNGAAEDIAENSLDSKGLQGAESKGVGQQAGNEGAAAEKKQGGWAFKAGSLVGGQKNKKKKKNKKKAFLIAGGLSLPFLVGVVLFFLFLSSWKSIHFAKVMGAAGFAEFNFALRRRIAQDTFDSAVLSADSTGTAVKQSGLLKRALRVDPERQLEEFGRQNRLKIDMKEGKDWLHRTTNDFEGFTFGEGENAKSVNLNKIAQDQWGQDFEKLGIREKMTVRKTFVDEVKISFNEEFATESRFVRWRTFKGIRDFAGIGMERWKQAARSWFGKKPEEAYKANMQNSVEEVTGESRVKTGNSAIDEAGQDAEDAVNEAIDENKPVDVDTIIDDVVKEQDPKGISKLGATQAGLLIATAACMIHDAFKPEKLDAASEANQVRAMRLGHGIQTTASQIEDGAVVSEAASADSVRWDGVGNNPDYLNDVGYNTGEIALPADYDVPNPTPERNNGFIDTINKLTTPSTYVGLAGAIPGVSNVANMTGDALCDIILNPAAQVAGAIALTAIQVASGGTEKITDEAGKVVLSKFLLEMVKTFGGTLKEAVTTKAGLGQLVGFAALAALLQVVIKYYAPLQFSGAETGGQLYAQGRVGTELLQRENYRQGLYGRPLSKEEATQVQSTAKTEIAQAYNEGGWTQKYFAVSNPYSLINRVAALTPSSFASITGSLRSSLSHLGSIFNPVQLASANSGVGVALLGKTQTAAADSSAKDYDFFHGVEQWGYSPAELNLLESDEHYTLDANALIVEGNQSHYDKVDYMVKNCFTLPITTKIASAKLPGNGYYTLDDDIFHPTLSPPDQAPYCTAAYLSRNDVFRYRIYHGMDEYAVGMMEDDFQAPDTSTSSTGGAIGGTATDPSNCPTDIVGQDQTTLVEGIRIHTCMAENLKQMLAAATAAGLKLSGSGWRDYNTQVSLRKAHCGTSDYAIYEMPSSQCHPPTAIPGRSNHERGLAVDFTCSGRQVSKGDPCFNWLVANAGQYHFINLPSEAWHWSLDGK